MLVNGAGRDAFVAKDSSPTPVVAKIRKKGKKGKDDIVFPSFSDFLGCLSLTLKKVVGA